jgi:hypothetical protein
LHDKALFLSRSNSNAAPAIQKQSAPRALKAARADAAALSASRAANGKAQPPQTAHPLQVKTRIFALFAFEFKSFSKILLRIPDDFK